MDVRQLLDALRGNCLAVLIGGHAVLLRIGDERFRHQKLRFADRLTRIRLRIVDKDWEFSLARLRRLRTERKKRLVEFLLQQLQGEVRLAQTALFAVLRAGAGVDVMKFQQRKALLRLVKCRFVLVIQPVQLRVCAELFCGK